MHKRNCPVEPVMMSSLQQVHKKFYENQGEWDKKLYGVQQYRVCA